MKIKIFIIFAYLLCTVSTLQAQSEINSKNRSSSNLYSSNEGNNNTDEHLSYKGLITEFMGIPVDGYKPEMIEKLESKGFIYNKEFDLLEGEFNGEQVYIFIKTNNNKVYRISVADKNTRNEQQIKIRFNRLCEQFENNKKYSFSGKSQIIPEETDISYEMNVENKSFEALYFQEIDINQIDTIALKNIFSDITDELIVSLKKTLNEEQSDKLKEVLKGDFGTDLMIMSLEFKKSVWFKIFKIYGEFYITLFYENEYNKANGEDL